MCAMGPEAAMLHARAARAADLRTYAELERVSEFGLYVQACPETERRRSGLLAWLPRRAPRKPALLAALAGEKIRAPDRPLAAAPIERRTLDDVGAPADRRPIAFLPAGRDLPR